MASKFLTVHRPKKMTFHDSQGRFRIQLPTHSRGLGQKFVRR